MKLIVYFNKQNNFIIKIMNGFDGGLSLNQTQWLILIRHIDLVHNN